MRPEKAGRLSGDEIMTHWGMTITITISGCIVPWGLFQF